MPKISEPVWRGAGREKSMRTWRPALAYKAISNLKGVPAGTYHGRCKASFNGRFNRRKNQTPGKSRRCIFAPSCIKPMHFEFTNATGTKTGVVVEISGRPPAPTKGRSKYSTGANERTISAERTNGTQKQNAFFLFRRVSAIPARPRRLPILFCKKRAPPKMPRDFYGSGGRR